jgi:N-acetyl sugar amidotransferase
MKRCSRCLLPETHETITFDLRGICSVCQNSEYRSNKIDWVARRDELDRLISSHRNKYDYDCIVPFSGGKDSTFTLYYIVNELNLKPLVVSFDHGFYRPITLENRERVVEKLGVDLLTFKPNWKIVSRLMLQSLIEKGDFCWHCHTGIFAYPMWIALEKRVPLIFWGEPSSEYTSYYSYEDTEEVDEDRFNQINTLGITAKDMFIRLGEDFDERNLKPYTYPPKKSLRELGVISLPLGSFIPWDTTKQSEIIMRELGWQGDEVEGVPGQYSYEKIECYMQGVRDYIKFRKRGYSRPTHLVSIDIRRDRMARTQGEKLVEEYEGVRPKTLDLFLGYVGLSEEQFNVIVDQHRVDPWVGKTFLQIGKKPRDFDLWRQKDGLSPVVAELTLDRQSRSE